MHSDGVHMAPTHPVPVAPLADQYGREEDVGLGWVGLYVLTDTAMRGRAGVWCLQKPPVMLSWWSGIVKSLVIGGFSFVVLPLAS